METMKLDDVVGAVPAHLFAGVWGTLAVCIAAGGNFVTQLVGVLAVGVFVFAASWILWLVLEKTVGVRVSETVEELGQDTAELGIEAYPSSCSCRTRTTSRRCGATDRPARPAGSVPVCLDAIRDAPRLFQQQ